jgi:hypothetical protein
VTTKNTKDGTNELSKAHTDFGGLGTLGVNMDEAIDALRKYTLPATDEDESTRRTARRSSIQITPKAKTLNPLRSQYKRENSFRFLDLPLGERSIHGIWPL